MTDKIDAGTDDRGGWIRLEKAKTFTHWSQKNDRFYATNVTHSSIPSAVYESGTDENDVVYLREIEFPTDELIDLSGTPVSFVLNQLEVFRNKLPLFNRLGLVYKRGIIFYGPAGCGKTSIVRLIADTVIKQKGLVLSVSDLDNDQNALLKLRQIEPNRQILAIFEDIEKFLIKEEDASNLLSFLDGEKQVGNIISIATTNKPDLLEDRLLKRPGRFDLVIGLNPPVQTARLQYLERLFKDFDHGLNLADVAVETDGLGLAHLRELVVSVVCLEQSYKDTLHRLKSNIKEVMRAPKIGQKCSTGFNLGFTSEEK